MDADGLRSPAARIGQRHVHPITISPQDDYLQFQPPTLRPGGTSIFVAEPACCRRKLKLGLLSDDTGEEKEEEEEERGLSLARGLTIVKYSGG